MEKATWYFDLISPFSYLHLQRLSSLKGEVEVQLIPVLFAGLLKHWGTKGPAELPTKRLHTYQYCVWQAGRLGVPFKMPTRHPFNPLQSLRLLVAIGAQIDQVKKAFEFVYGEGRDPEVEFDALAKRLGVDDPATLIGDPVVKQRLVANTQGAIDAGVFGVPALVVRDKLFWGSDTLEWSMEFLKNPDLFCRPEYQAAALSEFGVSRT